MIKLNHKNLLKILILISIPWKVNQKHKVDNIKLSKENFDLQLSLDSSNDQISTLKSKLDNLSQNVSKFNKGKESLNHLINTFKPAFDKNGLGFKKSKVSKPKRNYASLYTNFRKLKDNGSKKKIISSTIRIWVPKTNNLLIRNKYIDKFLSEVHLNSNFIFKGSTKPEWVWLPKI